MSRWLWLSLLLLLSGVGASAYLAGNRADYFPEQVAVHWNAAMEPDRFASRDDLFEVFWIFPALSTVTFLIFLALPWLSPRKFSINDFRGIYDYIVFLMIGLFIYLQAVTLYGQMKGEMPGRLFLGGLFLFFGLLGNVLGKVRKNFYVGVRTPWTLASDVVWERTHRLAAWLFVIAGLGGFLAVMLGVSVLWCIPALIVAGLVPVVYSLVIYKRLERAGKLEAE
ncbi:MAG: SdpI family protein [Gemmataceae bacterium]|nr:SdpI family protein [Gemmataceae bacterium]